MQATTGTSCSRCGVLKRETNHWFVVITNGAGGYWQPFDVFHRCEPGEDIAIVCGQSCFAKVTSAWFAEAK